MNASASRSDCEEKPEALVKTIHPDLAMIHKITFALLAIFAFAFSATATDAVHTGFFSNEALDGYDAVAYFKEGKPVEGKEAFTTKYNGAEWLFSSQENLDAFRKEPKKYAPQYGGYCAWAMGHDGSESSSDPEMFTIKDGKLYMNYNQSVRDDFLADIDNLIRQADENWKKLGFQSLN